MENEKILEVIQSMYAEMKEGFARIDKEMKEGFVGVDSRIEGLDSKIQRLDSKIQVLDAKVNSLDSQMKSNFARVDARIDKVQLTLEQTLTPKIEALFDGYTQTTDQLKVLDEKVDNFQISVNNISIKTLTHDNFLINLKKLTK